MRWIARNLVFLGLAAVVFCAPVWAQETSLSGTVTDPEGALVPGATVTVTNKATGVSRTTTTGDDGTYVFPQLAPGTYRVEVKKDQFKTAITDNVVVPVGLATSFNVSLELGAVTETMIVESETTRVNTTDASLGNPFSGDQVKQLPSLNLDPAGLLSLQAGVTFVPGAPDVAGGYSGVSDFDGRGGSVNGSRSDQTNITLDGVDVNDPINGYAFNSVLRATQASLAEFRVTTSNYNADQGRSSAAQVQLVTRSGTNEIHGEAYYAHRNEIFNANDFFLNRDDVERGKFRRHIYGGAAGGPIWKDRWFIFGNIEKLEEALSQPVERAIPSLSFRDGVLIYECADVNENDRNDDECPGNTAIGVSGQTWFADKDGNGVPDPGFYSLTPGELAAIDPAGIGPSLNALAHFQEFPIPNSPGTFDRLNIVGFNFAAPINNDFLTYILRSDFNIDRAANHTLWWRGTLQDDAIASSPQFPGLEPNTTRLGGNRGFVLGYRSLWGSNFVNTFRYGLTRISEATAGHQNSEFVDFRFIDNLEDYGSDSFGRKVPNHHIRDDASYIWGNHTLTFGGEMRFLRNDRFSNANSFHFFSTNPSWLPNVGRNMVPGESDFCTRPGCFAVPAVSDAGSDDYRDSVTNLLGIITQATASYNFDRTGATLPTGESVRRNFAVNEYELYFQDQWRMFQTVTFTYGIRYVLASPPWETNGNQVAPTPDLSTWFETRRQLMLAGMPSNAAPQLSFALGGPENNAPNYFDWDTNNWSPRVAVAWNPRFRDGMFGWLFGDGRTVFRAGYSLVYDRIGPALVTSFDNSGSFGMSTTIDSVFGGCGEGPSTAGPFGVCPRFTGVFDTAAASVLLPPSPGGSFPATPPGADEFGVPQPGSFAIASALDSGIRTPYSHAYNVSIGRELGSHYSLEFAYVGRSGRKLLMLRDMAMPADLCDPLSGQCYFDAAQELIRLFEQGVDINSLNPIPYWENLFPSFGPGGINGGFLPCDLFGVDPNFNGGFSATQVAYDWLNCIHPDTTVFPWAVDNFGFPGYVLGGPGSIDLDGDGLPDAPFAYFDDQFATLTAWSSIARSEYHAFQVMFRKRMSHGIQFDFNYTLSKSLDHSSTPERADTSFGFFTGGYSGSTINAWDPDLEYSFSDFDMRHQINTNFIVELPFGRGRWMAADVPAWLDHIVGGWMISGIVRINSGLPANVINARVWPTNWNLQGNATCKPSDASRFGVATGPCPATQNVSRSIGHGQPNLFRDPDAAFEFFRFTLPGQRGQRNILRGDHYFNLDLALGKTFNLPFEGHSFALRWEAFNVTNSVYFDTVSLTASIGSRGTFGDYSAVLGGPRRMQISGRYTF